MDKTNDRKFGDRPFNKVVTLIKQNDAATLKELYKLNFPKVRRYVLKNSGDEQQAKDVYQEAFLAMWLNIKDDRFYAKSETAINGYIYQIAKHKWLDYVRSVKYKNTTFINRELEYEESDTQWNQAQNRKIARVMGFVDQLNQRCQQLLRLFYFERKSYAEIAKICQLDEAYARTAKYRCMQELKKMAQISPHEPN